MKKGILLIALSIICITTSCKKDFVCSCKTQVSEGSITTELPKEDSVINDMNKKDASEACNAMDSFSTTGNVSTTKNCELN